jgi:hypothetical protein
MLTPTRRRRLAGCCSTGHVMFLFDSAWLSISPSDEERTLKGRGIASAGGCIVDVTGAQCCNQALLSLVWTRGSIEIHPSGRVSLAGRSQHKRAAAYGSK